jgi:drug/metabolite transporter (DMT)-like permease
VSIAKQTPVKQNVGLAIAFLLAALTWLPFMDALGKSLSQSFPVLQIVWARSLFHTLSVLPFVLWRYGAKSLLPQKLPLQITRSVVLLGGNLTFFGAIALIPMANALSLVFISPFIIAITSIIFLNEKVGLRRWSAIVFGLIGALIIFKPGGDSLGLGGFLGLAAGFCYGFYFLLTRILAGHAPPIVTLAFASLIGAVALSFASPWFWVQPQPTDWLWLILLGLMSSSGHFLLTLAFERAEASLLAPFTYFEIIITITLGYIFFDNFPDPLTWIGMSLIVGAGVFMAYREWQLERANRG